MRGILSSRNARTLAAGLSAIMLILLAAKGGPAWYRWQSAARASDVEVRATLARARASLRDTAAVRDSLAARAARLSALAPAVLTNAPPAAAGGMLASMLSDAAADAGMRVASIQVRPDTTRQNGYMRVGVRGELVGDIVGLQKLLMSIEGGLTLLSVRELSVVQPELTPPPGRPETLRVQLLVDALIAGPRSRSAR
jgi:hypothetical protein